MTTRANALPTQEMTINMGPQHPSTPWVLGCCGPMLIVISCVGRALARIVIP